MIIRTLDKEIYINEEEIIEIIEGDNNGEL